MTCRICLVALVLLTISSTLADEKNGTNSSVKVRDDGVECKNNLRCPSTLNKAKKKSPQCQVDEDCGKRELCHDFLKVCFAKPSQQSRMRTGKTTMAPLCKADGDCGRNQSCHAFFGRCLVNPDIPTVTTKPSAAIPACQDSSECPLGQYCHVFFNMCLPHFNYSFEPSPTAAVGCASDSECQKGEFCHNLTRLCLRMPAIASTTPPPKGSYSCKTHADCKMTEFCHFLIGMRRREKAKHNRHKQLKYSAALGVCIARALKNVPKDPRPIPSNCSQRSECEKGRCCLRDLGLCVGYRLPGELCVAQDVSVQFSCPCLTGFNCVSKGHMMRLRRLEKKLKLPKDASKRLSFHLEKSIKLKVGRCQLVSD